MEPQGLYALAADAVLLVHAAFVVFVILGLVLTLVGRVLAWSWVRDPWFRLVHLAAVGVVVLQSWAGVVCPLTTVEMALRRKAGGPGYEESFIAHWLHELLFYQAPGWVFVVVYTVFGGLVLSSWVWVRPRPFKKAAKRHSP